MSMYIDPRLRKILDDIRADADDITDEELAQQLADYAKTSDLSSYVETSVLSDYATTESLADYATTEMLADYATTEALADYAKTSDLSGYSTTDHTHATSANSFEAYERHVQIVAKADGTPANQPAQVDFGTVGGLQFATTGSKYAYAQFEVPDDWNGTDMHFEIDWFPDSGAMTGTDTIEWVLTYRCIAEGESIMHGTVKTISVVDDADYTQYQTKHARFTLPFNDPDQPITKQDHIYFQVTRNTAHANDFAGSVTAIEYELIYNSVGLPTSN